MYFPQIIDTSTGQSLGPNQRGELCVKGPQVMPGYKDLPEQTAQTIDRDGWLHTGKDNISVNVLLEWFYNQENPLFLQDRPWVSPWI